MQAPAHCRTQCDLDGARAAASPRQACSVLFRRSESEEKPVLDLVLIVLTVGFFALAWAYVRGLERL